MSKKVLILGINGFLGHALAEHISRNPHYKIFGISRRKSKNQHVFQSDIQHLPQLKVVLAKVRPDIIFHLAGGRQGDLKELIKNNFISTLNLFQLVEELKLSVKIIIPGTAAEYGKPVGKFLNEQTPTHPISPYGFVKALQVQLALTYAQRGLDVTVARIFNVVGAGIPSDLALGEFSRQIAAIEAGVQKPVIQTKNLSGLRDFLDVRDVVSALMTVALKGKSGEIYNICSGRAEEIRQLLKDLIAFSMSKKIKIKEDKKSSSGSYNIIGSNRKLKSLGWQPKVSVHDSLFQTLNYYRTLSH